MLTFFEISTLEMWPDMMFEAVDQVGYDKVQIIQHNPPVALIYVIFIFLTCAIPVDEIINPTTSPTADANTVSLFMVQSFFVAWNIGFLLFHVHFRLACGVGFLQRLVAIQRRDPDPENRFLDRFLIPARTTAKMFDH